MLADSRTNGTTIDYDRSPEAHYPVAIEQSFAVMQWVANNGPSLRLDPSRFVIAGDSVGGNMAADLALLAKERVGPHLDFQVLLCPVTEADFTPSYEEFANGPWLTARRCDGSGTPICPTCSRVRSRRCPPTAWIPVKSDMWPHGGSREPLTRRDHAGHLPSGGVNRAVRKMPT